MSKAFNRHLARLQASFGKAVAMGKARNISGTVKYFNATASASEEDFWTEGGNLSYLDSAETMSVVSTDANDTDQGTGAWTVKIVGLDENWKIAYETVTLNGLTPVVTTTTFIRVWRMSVESGGTITGAIGTITATASVAATVQASIQIGANQTLMSHFTPPSTHVAFIAAATLSVGSGKEVEVLVKTRDNNTANSVFKTKRTFNVFESSLRVELPIPRLIPSMVDYKWTVKGSAASVPCAGDYDLYLIDKGLVNIEEALPLQYEII